MKAKDFFKIYTSTLKAPTNRKIANLARKFMLSDTLEEISWWTGLTGDDAEEFRRPTDKEVAITSFNRLSGRTD